MSSSTPVFESNFIFEEYIEETHFRGFSVGYEMEEYRYDALVEHIFSALVDFSLPHSELSTFTPINAQRKMRSAAKAVYATDKYRSRGEYGEILLHIVMRDYFNTVPAISKMYYKDGPNETVKGFDAVHIVDQGNDLELWLGEVKFYQSISGAIRDVIPELQAHVGKDYLRNEFLCISNKIDNSWEHAEKMKMLIDGRTSLDKIFKRIRIPVLLTYDSKVVSSYKEVNEEYQTQLIEELNKHHDKFRSNELPKNIDVILILIPFEQKKRLVELLHKKLKVWQQI
ncbi:HamA C-terminal domain-containing protein [Bacillus mobilis]|uniref:HamA C-terminal domain-containing protein n=1 Tax=Bacillus mobilis TaxID=2026190 RepID=UPI0021D06373|nr:DUF1837 domain-containing protein [Bacillus mobilis]MCU5198214.1 DUF1837 domain-containing protein [Bacillus mobilis]